MPRTKGGSWNPGPGAAGRGAPAAPQSVVLVHDQQLVGPHVLCKKTVRAFDRIGPQFGHGDGGRLRPRGHDFDDPLGCVAGADDVPGEQPEQPAVLVDDGKGAKGELLLL